MIGGNCVALSTYIYVHKNGIVIALSELPARHGHGMGYTGNAITDLACLFLYHQGNKQFILDDQYARRVLNIAGNAADDMTSGWYPGRMLMMTQHRLHRSRL